ncbi:hypothetical protein J6590_044942 [Homalodisca vitripennis]|nr:hypothetical protein J6590_044942 [Homalodisca vitripennis]
MDVVEYSCNSRANSVFVPQEITENPEEELVVENLDSESPGCANVDANSPTPPQDTVVCREPSGPPSATARRPSAAEPQHPSKMRKLDVELNGADDTTESTGAAQRPKTTAEIFAEYVAAKLRGYPEYTRNVVQHKINNILFEADMGTYAKPDSS